MTTAPSETCPIWSHIEVCIITTTYNPTPNTIMREISIDEDPHVPERPASPDTDADRDELDDDEQEQKQQLAPELLPPRLIKAAHLS